MANADWGATLSAPIQYKSPVRYELGDVYSGSGLTAGSPEAKVAQAANEPSPTKTVAPAPAPASPKSGYGLDSDAGVALARALENQGIGSLDSWLKSARERAIIQSGDPALAGMAGFGLDPQAGTFAQQNYLSGNADLARVDRAKKLAHRAIINRLAARGLLRSGDLGYLEGESNIDFGNQEYDVRQNVLSKLSDFMKQYLDQKQALKQSTLGAYQTAYQRLAENPGLLSAVYGGNQPDQSASAYDGPLSSLFNTAKRKSSEF